MKIFSFPLIGVFLIAQPLVASAQDRNAELMKNIYNKMESILGVGDVSASKPSGLFVMAAPGLALDPKLNTDVPEEQGRLVQLLDVVMQPGWIYRASDLRVSGIYQSILTNNETASFPLSAVENKQLANARALVFKPGKKSSFTIEFQKYQDTRDDLAQALADVQDFQRSNPNRTIPPKLTSRLKRADEAYRLLGNKNEMSAAKSTIDNLESRNPAVYWARLKEQYSDNTFQALVGLEPRYTLSPTYKSWFDDSQSWGKYTLSDKELQVQTSSSHTSISGGVGGGWGMFSFGGNYGKTETSTRVNIDGKDYQLSFELLRVNLTRPWMDGSVFRSTTWRWQPNAEIQQLISDGGDVNNGVTPTGVMPLLATELILARKVSITAGWASDLKTTFDSQTTVSGRAGWGPFSGSYSRTDIVANTSSDVKITGNTITFDSPQIIGYLVNVLPKSPNPRVGLKFPSDQGAIAIGNLRLVGEPLRAYIRDAASSDKLLQQSANILKPVQ